jgi:enoyl-CoA hydratase/carnithine racemase
VLPDDRLNDAVAELAGKIVAKSPYALAIGKETFYRQAELGLAWPMPAPARS